MVCTFARFVIHYKNGETLIEDRKDSYCWDNASKKNISALGILFDPVLIFDVGSPKDKPKPILDSTGKQVRITLPEMTLKGSSRYQYQFFQQKEGILILQKGEKQQTVALQIGMVIDSHGHCIVMQGKPYGQIKNFYTTVHSLGLNLDHFEIDLEKCGKKID
jgi:hypothetical protein